MDAVGTGQVLASKGDAAHGVVMFLKVMVGSLPAWMKWVIGSLLAVAALCEGYRWWRGRETAVR
ncbi:hypothetical protein [Streptomyces sp. NPDC001594]|uniref:hypothetical protein n=1 Tax=Streptomyces sp. NPDC001594 TaxID=3364590 RepID=UPI00369F0689